MELDSFHNLDGSVEASEERFGTKIHILSKLLRETVPVPKGYYFTLDRFSGFLDNEFTTKARTLLEIHHEKLVDGDQSMKCIVRSSSSVEDKPNHQFSGLFESRKNVVTFEDLFMAIKQCFASKNTDKIRNYAGNFGININDIKLAILVQQQIEPSISGLAHLECHPYNRSYSTTDYIEIVEGDMERLIAGESNPIAFELHHEHGYRPFLEPRSHGDGVYTSILGPHLAELAYTFQRIKDILKQSVLVEFCIEHGNGLRIFQARPYPLIGSDPIRIHKGTKTAASLRGKQKVKILENEEKWGLKGAAMVTFRQMGVISPTLVMF